MHALGNASRRDPMTRDCVRQPIGPRLDSPSQPALELDRDPSHNGRITSAENGLAPGHVGRKRDHDGSSLVLAISWEDLRRGRTTALAIYAQVIRRPDWDQLRAEIRALVGDPFRTTATAPGDPKRPATAGGASREPVNRSMPQSEIGRFQDVCQYPQPDSNR
jgi:hypothetical protein